MYMYSVEWFLVCCVFLKSEFDAFAPMLCPVSAPVYTVHCMCATYNGQ